MHRYEHKYTLKLNSHYLFDTLYNYNNNNNNNYPQ